MHSAELSIVVPTYKERGNVAELVRRLDAALTGISWEAIFVDDNSPDGTARSGQGYRRNDDNRVRCLRRVGRRGLAGACIEGMLSSASPFVAVMDADLQHDEKVLPADAGADCEAAAPIWSPARAMSKAAAPESFSRRRGAMSRAATELTRRLVGTSSAIR